MDKKNFRISSALKDLIGKDLITNDNVAIFELVKNSYDAYATKVEITFNEDSIIIADNGKGMTYNDLMNKWLFLGFSAKKDGTEDSESDKQKSYRDNINRHYAGAKGIGRFSCDRLGKRLDLTTRNEASSTTEKLFIDWTDFEKDQSEEFIDISVDYESLSDIPVFPENKKTGTILEIIGLHEGEWNRDKILKLKQSLEKLINPFSETEDFSIEIICKNQLKADEEEKKHSEYYDKDIVNGEIENSIAEILNLKTTRIDVMLSGDTVLTILSDRDTPIYKIKERNLLYPRLKYVDIHLYFLNRAAKLSFNRIMGVHPVNYGSIFLFRNGFRILPFGNEGDDSWGLDYRAQQGFNRNLGTRDLFGRVDVQTDDVNDLKEVSSRDGGLIDTEVSKQLFDFFTVTHRRLERYVKGVLWGEAFLRKEYFNSQEEGELKRKELQAIDKDSDNTDYLFKSSIGSKIDFVQLIKTLIKDKNIEILEYNKDLANIFSSVDNIADIKPQFIDDFEKVAKETKNGDLLFSLDEAKKELLKLQSEKEEAVKRAEKAEAQRNSAIERANNAEMERKFAESRADRAEEEERHQKKRADVAEADLHSEKKRTSFLMDNLSTEQLDFAERLHQVGINIDAINTTIETLTLEKRKGTLTFDGLWNEIKDISYCTKRIESILSYAVRAKFNTEDETISADLFGFITDYCDTIINKNSKKIKIQVCNNSSLSYTREFAPQDIGVILDNVESNSRKANAKNLYINIKEDSSFYILEFIDDGIGLDRNIIKDVNSLFEFGKGFTDNGSGVGLYHIKYIVEQFFDGYVAIDENYIGGFKLIIGVKK